MTQRGQLQTQLIILRVAMEDIGAFTADLDDAALATLPEADPKTYRAVRGALAEISVVVAALPADLRARHPAVDWRGWAGLCELLAPDELKRHLPRLALSLREDMPALWNAITAELASVSG